MSLSVRVTGDISIRGLLSGTSVSTFVSERGDISMYICGLAVDQSGVPCRLALVSHDQWAGSQSVAISMWSVHSCDSRSERE